MIRITRIRKARRYLASFKDGELIRVGVSVNELDSNDLAALGFSDERSIGERVLPDASLSKAAMENSEGKFIRRKDLPMEQAERYWEWSWEDWGGNTHTDSTFIPYMRYVREYLPPMAIELVLAADENENIWIVTDPIEVSDTNLGRIQSAVNLFLSLFKQCEIMDKDLQIPIIPTRTCDWELLAPGQNPEEKIHRTIAKRVPESKQSMYVRNIGRLLGDQPTIVAIGTKGFLGYMAFEYPDMGITVLESLMPNNATYIFGTDWEGLSKLTKREILGGHLQIDRILHYSNWNDRISKYIEDKDKE